MISLNLSDLQRKDVIDIKDGKRLGRIVDAYIKDDGMLDYFIVVERRLFFFYKNSSEKNIILKNIKKIGTDVILVDIEEF